MKLLKKIAVLLSGLFSGRTLDAILHGIQRAAPYINAAMELAAVVATATAGPAGRTIATVLAAADTLGVPALLGPDTTEAELGTVMRNVVVAGLKRKFPGASEADLIRAVEIAVGAIKGGKNA